MILARGPVSAVSPGMRTSLSRRPADANVSREVWPRKTFRVMRTAITYGEIGYCNTAGAGMIFTIENKLSKSPILATNTILR